MKRIKQSQEIFEAIHQQPRMKLVPKIKGFDTYGVDIELPQFAEKQMMEHSYTNDKTGELWNFVYKTSPSKDKKAIKEAFALESESHKPNILEAVQNLEREYHDIEQDSTPDSPWQQLRKINFSSTRPIITRTGMGTVTKWELKAWEIYNRCMNSPELRELGEEINKSMSINQVEAMARGKRREEITSTKLESFLGEELNSLGMTTIRGHRLGDSIDREFVATMDNPEYGIKRGDRVGIEIKNYNFVKYLMNDTKTADTQCQIHYFVSGYDVVLLVLDFPLSPLKITKVKIDLEYIEKMMLAVKPTEDEIEEDVDSFFDSLNQMEEDDEF